jgi:hypothetical protein
MKSRVFYRIGGSLCPEDTKVCDDGSTVARQGVNCIFPDCPAVPRYHPTKIGIMMIRIHS